MWIQCPCAGRPALGEDLHGEQLGVDFRFERPSRADRPARTVVRFHRFVRAIGHIPDIRLRHGSLTPKTPEGFIFAAKRPRGVAIGIAGALVANWLFPKLGIPIGTDIVREILYSAIGAVVLLLIVRLIRTGGRF